MVGCTGLGSRELFDDRELTPIKARLTVLPQPDVDHAVRTEDLCMFPRPDGILLGGTHERGVETLEPNPEAWWIASAVRDGGRPGNPIPKERLPRALPRTVLHMPGSSAEGP